MRKLMLIAAVAAAAAGHPTIASAGYCEELRLACEHKDSLGETGGGNCKAYRAACEPRVTRVSCRNLRYYCLHKDEYGLGGQGYCETYRESCR